MTADLGGLSHHLLTANGSSEKNYTGPRGFGLVARDRVIFVHYHEELNKFLIREMENIGIRDEGGLKGGEMPACPS
jgi:hypothetical protein